MQYGVLLILSVFAFSINAIMTRTFQVKMQISKEAINLYQALFTIVASLAYFTMSFIQGISFSVNIILPAMSFGICFAFASLFSAKSMEMGYMSLSSVIINLSLILPVMFSWIVMRESVKLNAVIGLLLIIVTLVLSSINVGKGEKGDIKKWLLFVLIAFFANGSSAIVQKIYKSDFGEGDLMLFMAFSYLVSSLIFGVTYFCENLKYKVKFNEQITKPLMLPIIAIVSGLGSFAGNGLLGILCDKINGGILYPCINGGLSIVVAISSFVIFKEKVRKNKIIAICTGVLAIILLNL